MDRLDSRKQAFSLETGFAKGSGVEEVTVTGSLRVIY